MRVIKICVGWLELGFGVLCFLFPFGSPRSLALITAAATAIIGLITMFDYLKSSGVAKHSKSQLVIGAVTLTAAVIGFLAIALRVNIGTVSFATDRFGAIFLISVLLNDGMIALFTAMFNRDYSFIRRFLAILFGVNVTILTVTAYFFLSIVIMNIGHFTAVAHIALGLSLLLGASSIPKERRIRWK